MSYPKAKLTPGVDAAGVYICDIFDVTDVIREWDGEEHVRDSHGLQYPVHRYTNFRPLSLTPAAPEVVEGPAELPEGTWLVRNATATYTVDEFQTGARRLITHEQRAFRIPDAWLAVLKSKPAPVVTDKHREAAKRLAEVSPNDDAELLREYQRILAESFPAEVVK
jgi:hypothetical protein